MLPFFITALLVVVVLMVVRTLVPPDSEVIARWAAKENLTVLELKRHYLRQGPFTFSMIEGAVYAIVVEDRENQKREGWLCIPYGQWKKSRVDVRWKTGCLVGFTS